MIHFWTSGHVFSSLSLSLPLAVHTVLQDLLPPSVYYRFNPVLSDPIAIDDARPAQLQLLVDDAMRYIDKNQEVFEQTIESLLRQKTLSQRAQEWYTAGQWRRVIDWRIHVVIKSYSFSYQKSFLIAIISDLFISLKRSIS